VTLFSRGKGDSRIGKKEGERKGKGKGKAIGFYEYYA